MSEGEDGGPDQRISDRDREAAVTRLQHAFSGGFLDVEELDTRIGGAYKARTRSDLLPLVADLPTEPPMNASMLVPASRGAELQHTELERTRRISLHRSKLEKGGRWLVPERFKISTYKSVLVLDLRETVLSAPVTILTVSCYKSRIEIIVPPGFQADLQGSSYKAEWNARLPSARSDGPLLQLRGSNYKGVVTVREEPVDIAVARLAAERTLPLDF